MGVQRMTIERILRRLRYELRMRYQEYVPFNRRYKPKGVVNVSRVTTDSQRYYEYNAPYTSELTLSPDFVAACSPYIKPVMKIDVPGDFVVGLRKGRLYCTNGSHIATINEDGYVVEELSFQWGDERIDEARKNKVLEIHGFVTPKKYRGKVFSLMSGGGAKYLLYHWMLETVPKMHLFLQSGEIDKDSYFVIPNQRMQYQKEFLKHFGIDASRIIDEEEIHHVEADWLYVSSHIKYYDHHPKWSCDFLCNTVVPVPIKNPNRLIYISRGDASRNRRVENEPQLEAALSELGFESVQLSPLTIYEKAHVFNSASIIVAVHGGGLANLVYCQPGTKVLEIFPDQYVRHAYYDIADKRGLQYDYMLLPASGEAQDALQGQKLGVALDVEKVMAKVVSILQREQVEADKTTS